MFFGLCDLLADGNPEYASLPPRVRNAVVESALLHARQLTGILLSQGSFATDIKLSSLVPGFTPRRKGELESFYGTRNKPGGPCEILNTRLAHATTHRGTSHDYSALLNQLAPMLGDIVQEVLGQQGQTRA